MPGTGVTHGPGPDGAVPRGGERSSSAAAHVAAIHEATDREIAELRATVLALSDELRQVAAYVTENLTPPGQPPVPPPPAS